MPSACDGGIRFLVNMELQFSFERMSKMQFSNDEKIKPCRPEEVCMACVAIMLLVLILFRIFCLRHLPDREQYIHVH